MATDDKQKAQRPKRQAGKEPTAGEADVTVEATGGGWYEVKLRGEVVDKVQGQRAAKAAVRRVKSQL